MNRTGKVVIGICSAAMIASMSFVGFSHIKPQQKIEYVEHPTELQLSDSYNDARDYISAVVDIEYFDLDYTSKNGKLTLKGQLEDIHVELEAKNLAYAKNTLELTVAGHLTATVDDETRGMTFSAVYDGPNNVYYARTVDDEYTYSTGKIYDEDEAEDTTIPWALDIEEWQELIGFINEPGLNLTYAVQNGKIVGIEGVARGNYSKTKGKIDIKYNQD